MASRGAVERVAVRGSMGVESFESRGEQREAARESLKLTPAERGDLEELWGATSAVLGVRSVHGAIEDKLRRSPPREDARRYITEELERAGGRAPEGRVLRIVVSEGWCTRYEAKRALQLMVLHEHVERVRVEMPAGHGSAKKKKHSDGTEERDEQLTDAQHEWTGFDLKLLLTTKRELAARLAIRRSKPTEQVRAERWSAQDEALRLSCQEMHVSDIETYSPYGRDPEMSPARRAKVTRATMALADITPLSAHVLQAFLALARPREGDEEAVARILHVGRVRASELIAEAVEQYKAARRKVVACHAR